MLLLTTYYNILLCFNKLGVGSNMIFLCSELTTLLFFCIKTMLHRCFFVSFYTRFLLVFTSILLKNRKKSANFLQFFLSVYQLVRRNLKK